jgi:hypothetical protein
MTPADRRARRVAATQEWRRRRRAGKRVYLVECDDVELPAALIEAGFLHPQLEDDARAVGAAASRMLAIVLQVVDLSTLPPSKL